MLPKYLVQYDSFKKLSDSGGFLKLLHALSKQHEHSFLLSVAYHDYWVYHINRYIEGTFIKLFSGVRDI
jgi:hypothetical protein